MFAPPPAPALSRAEAERRLAAQKAEKGRPSPPAGVDQRAASPAQSKLATREKQNIVSTEKKRRRHQAVLLPNSPPHTPPPRTPPPLAPHRRIDRGRVGSPSLQRQDAVKRAFLVFEEPRQAPLPPKRPPRPPSELFLPPPPEPPKHGRVQISRPIRIDESPPPPPIPDKSPLRQVVSITKDESRASLSPKPLFSDLSPKPSTPPPRPQTIHSVSGSIVSTASTRIKAPPRQHPSLTDATFSAALARMKARGRRGSSSSTSSHSTTSSVTSSQPGSSIVRSSTTPPSLARVSSLPSLRAARDAVFMGGIKRSPAKARQAKRASMARSLDSHLGQQRVHTASHIRAALLEIDDRKRTTRRDSIAKVKKPSSPPGVRTVRKRRKKGETMSILLDAGFFPVEEIIYGKKKKPKRPPSEWHFRINLPPRLSFIERDLPQTPSSITTTPTELYQTSPTTPRSRARYRGSGGSMRRPLSQISESDANASSDGGGALRKESESCSPTRLAAIPEDSAAGENSPPASGVSTHVATQIHLRGGSVITVTPPEVTAWQPTIYIHGPIKLPTPQIMPRKNSVASLEPFQEAIDQVYQHALAIPRRRSDDVVVDDICEFFDGFGFEMVSFDGDRLSLVDSDMDSVEEMEYEAELERFSTPPPEQPVASPVEVVIAKEVVEKTSKPPPVPTPNIVVPQVIAPPVENEETLRARGIARLSRGSAGSFPSSERKESFTLGKDREGSLPLLPPPEESMLDAVLQPSRGTIRDSVSYASSMHSSRRGRDSMVYAASTGYATSTHSSRFGRDNCSVHSSQVADQGFDWDDDVQEIDAGSSWVAPVAAPKKPGLSRGLSTRKTRNPVVKMRRLVATASTIL